MSITQDEINSFPLSRKAGFESPSDQLITLTYGQLQDLVKGAICQAIQPLQDEVAALREEKDQEITSLRESVASLEKSLLESEIFFGDEIARLRQRISKTEHKEPLKQTVNPYLDKINARLMELKNTDRPPAMTHREVAVLLDLTRGRVSQLQPVIARDGRFVIVAKGKKKMICLRY